MTNTILPVLYVGVKFGESHLFKLSGYLMHHHVYIQKCTFRPHCIYAFCIYLRANSDFCLIKHSVMDFCNRDGKCLLSGTNWIL
jgi:hypothetical protein